jgi:hypothetical protein
MTREDVIESVLAEHFMFYPDLRDIAQIISDKLFDWECENFEEVLSGWASCMGALGGEKGGAARAASLSPERRSEIARLAANKRWRKKNQQ